MKEQGASQQQQESTPREQADTKAPMGLGIVGEDDSKRPPADPATFDKFIQTVFHGGLLAPDDPTGPEHIMFWRATGTPGYPMGAKAAKRKLTSTGGQNAAWYYGTAVTRADENGELRNKKALFSSLHVVVLDDIGTKVARDSLPEALRNPSYVIESSPGNYQYGLVLDAPIEDYNQASALIQLVYTSGYTDAGGRMPTKLVRLPFGINGKPGEKHDFPVTLHSLTARTFSPEEILTAIDADVSWSDVCQDPTRVDKNLKTSSIGAVAWQPLTQPVTTDGATDAVLDWFEHNDMVQSYGNDWVTVRCPWAHLHTNGDDKAGYSPLGLGDGRWRNFRTFKCFHEHCADRDCTDLIHMLHETGQVDTLYPVYDPSWPLRKRLVLDAESHGVLDLDATDPAASIKKIATADLAYCQTAPNPDPKKAPIKLFDMYKRSPEKLLVQGLRYQPGADWPFYEQGNQLWMNAFTRPQFGSGKYDSGHAEIFFDHMRFLCNGNEDDYAYLANWFVCKVHDPQFRGNAILMTTEAYGVGRDTMASMMGMVLGQNNVRGVTPEQLASPYTDFLESQLVVCSETLDAGLNGSAGYYQFYERLKDLIDPAPREQYINHKFGRRYSTTVYTSFLLLSNHTDALRLGANDRRVYAIGNPTRPQAPEYYVKLREAMAHPDFARDVYRYIMAERKPDFALATKPAPATETKQVMARESMPALDVGLKAMLEVMGTAIVAGPALTDLLKLCPELSETLLHGQSPSQRGAFLRKTLNKLSVPSDERGYFNNRRCRVRVLKALTGEPAYTPDEMPDAMKTAEAGYAGAAANPDQFTADVLERMEDIWAGD